MSPTIADRIAKCDALANSNIPGEAAAARAMGKRLREKYGEPPSTRQFDPHDRTRRRAETTERYDRAAAAARTQTSEAFEARMRSFREQLDRSQARRAAEAFNSREIMCVAVDGGWLLASTGTKVLTDFELVSHAHRTIWQTFWGAR